MQPEYEWQRKKDLEFIETMAPVRIIGSGRFSYCQLMQGRATEELLAIKTVYKDFTKSRAFLNERVSG